MYDQIALLHLALVAPAPLLGAYLLLRTKGTPQHRLLGRVYVAFMLATAVASLFMPAQVGPQLIWHFGWIHLLSIWTLISIFFAIYCIRHGNIRGHRGFMIGMYVGMMVAFAFTFTEGRLLHSWVFA